MNDLHIKLFSGISVTGTSLGVAWTTVDMFLRMSASLAGLVAGILTAAVAIRTLRKK
jgi:hypothetical protein